MSGDAVSTAPPGNPQAAPLGQCVLVIEIGGTSIKFGYVVDGRPHAFTRKYPSDLMRRADPLSVLADCARAVIAEAGLAPDSIVATAPGHIDRDFDLLLHIVNVQEMNGMRMASGLAAALGLPVMLERDVVLLLLGERAAGAALGEDHVLGVFFGTGIGAAYLGARGEPFRGGGWALEIGHMPFRGEGRQLAGQTVDTLEAYASGRAVQQLADRSGVPVGDLFVAPDRPAWLMAALDELVRDQAFCVGAAIAMMSPKLVILGGGVAEMPGYPRDALVARIKAHSPLPAAVGTIDIRWARLGWEAALFGAGDLVRQGQRRPVMP
ncbi:MAG: ROK family protein [Hyphomicrobiaceae bacterium]|nr:ROK family protein [Hyphomicrobiaceae bacterium]